MSHSPFPWHELSADEMSRELSEGLRHFTTAYVEQFSVRIPTGILPIIDDIRDTYVPYLNDSEYKSNICYLLHLIQYQLWNYKIFRPKLSLENAFFYQQMVTLGIIAEALAHAILLNPCIEIEPGDRSLGKVAEAYIDLHEQISRRSFAQNIDLLAALKVIDLKTREEYHKIRAEMRNLVHIQGWDGRLYQSVTYNYFANKLKSFMKLMVNLKQNINLNFSPQDLKNSLQGSREIYYGKIISYYSNKGFGFISCHDFPDNVFFHINDFDTGQTPIIEIENEVIFSVKLAAKGMKATGIKRITL